MRSHRSRPGLGHAAFGALAVLPLFACQPKVQVEAPKEPITVNVNVKIEHEVRVKVDRDLEDLFAKNPEAF